MKKLGSTRTASTFFALVAVLALILALPAPASAQKRRPNPSPPPNPEISRAIKSFIANPSLRVNSPNDAELRAAAGHDMEGIIKLSETINKIAKALSKTLVASK